MCIHVGEAAISSEPAKKILLCTRSNAAIDEIAGRLKEGYRGSQQKASSLTVVRIGTLCDNNARMVVIEEARFENGHHRRSGPVHRVELVVKGASYSVNRRLCTMPTNYL